MVSIQEAIKSGKNFKNDEYVSFIMKPNQDYIFSTEMVLSNDWEIIDDKKPTLSDKITTRDKLEYNQEVVLQKDVKEAVKEFMNFIDNDNFITCKEEIKTKAKEIFGDRIGD